MELMRKIGKNLERYYLNGISDAALKRRVARKSGIVFLMYHSIPLGITPYRYACPRACFEQHCELLEELFEVVSMDQAYRIYSGAETKTTSRPLAVITFDDGFGDNYEVAYPILRRFKFPFLVFLATDFIEDGNSTFMSWEQVGQMASDCLVSVGAHSNRHINLTALVNSDKEVEVVDSGKRIGENINKEVQYFAYPSGGYDNRSLKLVGKNYKLGFKDRVEYIDDWDPRKMARVSIDSRHCDKKSFLIQLATVDFMVV